MATAALALTIPLALLFSFIFLHARGVAANLLSIGAIDLGILIDGTLVMVGNMFRELVARDGQSYDRHEMILSAAKDVDRPSSILSGHHCRPSTHLCARRILQNPCPPDIGPMGCAFFVNPVLYEMVAA